AVSDRRPARADGPGGGPLALPGVEATGGRGRGGLGPRAGRAVAVLVAVARAGAFRQGERGSRPPPPPRSGVRGGRSGGRGPRLVSDRHRGRSARRRGPAGPVPPRRPSAMMSPPGKDGETRRPGDRETRRGQPIAGI